MSADSTSDDDQLKPVTLRCVACHRRLTGPSDNPQLTVLVLCPTCLRDQIIRLHSRA